MTIIIAVLALLISLIALWLGSANLKKLDTGTKEIKSQLKTDLDAMKAEIEKKILTIGNRVDAFEAKLDGITEGQTQAKETVKGLQADIAKARKELDNLLFNLPPQFKQRQPSSNPKRDYG